MNENIEEDYIRILLGIDVKELETNPVIKPLLKLTMELIKKNHQMEIYLSSSYSHIDKREIKKSIDKHIGCIEEDSCILCLKGHDNRSSCRDILLRDLGL